MKHLGDIWEEEASERDIGEEEEEASERHLEAKSMHL